MVPGLYMYLTDVLVEVVIIRVRLSYVHAAKNGSQCLNMLKRETEY